MAGKGYEVASKLVGTQPTTGNGIAISWELGIWTTPMDSDEVQDQIAQVSRALERGFLPELAKAAVSLMEGKTE